MDKKGKIIVIDDDPDIVEATKIILESSDYEVISADDGDTGMEMIKSERPDLIILDIMMPKEDGDFVARALKKDPELANIPIIVITALEEKRKMKIYLDEDWLPADVLMNKPIKPEELLKRVNGFMAAKGK